MGMIAGLLAVSTLLLGCGSRSGDGTGTTAAEAAKPAATSTLHVHLQTGFNKNRVVISVDGAKVAEFADVTTSRLIGLANDKTAVPLKRDAVIVQVALDDGDQQAQYVLAAPSNGEDIWLGVSIVGSEIEFIKSSQALGYG
ncbi:MAG: hypothetical protein ACKV2O_22050 [Acidimicrobiales bacterium]